MYHLNQRNPRTTAILAVAKANGLDLETVEVDTKNPTPAFLEANPLSKVPAFVGTDGYVLTESMAIAIYRMFFSRFFYPCFILPHYSRNFLPPRIQ